MRDDRIPGSAWCAWGRWGALAPDGGTLERYRRSQGRDHLSTLRSAANLAADLHALGQPADPRLL
jgi:hypothetical protein